VNAAVGNAPNVNMTAVLRGDVVSSSAFTYNWALASKPTGSNAAITDTNAVNPSFKADVAGDYVATVTITDGSMNVSTSLVTLTACNASPNTSSPFSGCISSVGDGNILIQTSAGSFEAPKQVATYSYSAIKGFNFAVRYLYPLDIDDDGIDELLVAGFETQPNTPATYKNTKISLLGWRNGNFVDLTSQWLPNGADQVEGVGDVAVGDFNHDGRLDIFLSAYSDMDFNVNAYQLINKGGYFEKSVVENLVGWQHGVAAADINRDGYTDVFSVGYSSSPRIYLGGPGGLTPRHLLSYAGGSGVALADFLKDGTTTADALQALSSQVEPPGTSGIDSWLKSAKKGFCGHTKVGSLHECRTSDRGSIGLSMQAARSLRSAVRVCLNACAKCERCNYITVNPEVRDCSWYAMCDMDHLLTEYHGFLSGPVVTARGPASLAASPAVVPEPQEVILCMHMEKTAGTTVRSWFAQHGWQQTNYCSRFSEVQGQLVELLRAHYKRIFVEHHCGLDW
jgi:hypothetical protein